MPVKQWRDSKAERFFQAARDAFDHGHWETTLSRAYYAVYHLVIAVLEDKANLPQQRWGHRGLLAQFRATFCNRGYLFNVRDGEAFYDLMRERLSADYENIVFNEKRVERSLRRAESLHAKISEVLRDG